MRSHLSPKTAFKTHLERRYERFAEPFHLIFYRSLKPRRCKVVRQYEDLLRHPFIELEVKRDPLRLAIQDVDYNVIYLNPLASAIAVATLPW